MRATPPPPPNVLPCQRDPEPWFERGRHADALAGCLSCPARRWCAREALECRASWGLWAGVWIDGRHDDAVPHLRAIVADVLQQAAPVAAAPEERPRAADRIPARLHRPAAPLIPASARTAVLARSSGHCEILAEDCRLSLDRIVTRRAMRPESPAPPDLFAACHRCAEMVAALDPNLSARFGYLVDGHRDPGQVPFYWRQSRWVLLDRDGWLTELLDQAQSA
ncbi:hypothetical protein GGC64_005986 [Mycobacterium sp. OAS707]|uniref:WhiB family transcriptional regulator n=1 Tax=Mycobacterium sp. OAS707 TaxID=2663822 RepID=UPI0019DA74EB|nr:WhiB family transcriptional regulator [Mycobacterium sp. OAS707]MBE1551899.1 hypothetical protein [Mycobacterium sp. OAS707]